MVWAWIIWFDNIFVVARAISIDDNIFALGFLEVSDGGSGWYFLGGSEEVVNFILNLGGLGKNANHNK